ncbi:dihydrofolate reductase family protein [Luteolibacter sp. Populi]|uniref:dihydrofolate reductase family protein n=1 Tax=Luteolibacter sp. Populi TaxID=3230487 RepID=UPI003465428E
MRKLILKMSVSLDAFVAGPKGESAWIFRGEDDEMTEWSVAKIREAGVHIMGSRTYQDMAAYWPCATDAYAPAMNEIPKLIFSKQGSALKPDENLTTISLKDAPQAGPKVVVSQKELDGWIHPQVASGDLTEEITRLKQQPGKDILAHGGASFARSLVAARLVDEYQLLIHPVILGKGSAIFSGLDEPLYLKIVDNIPFPSGAIARIYRPEP